MSRVLDAILKKTKLVKKLIQQNENLKSELETLMCQHENIKRELGAEKLNCMMEKNNYEKMKKESEHAKAITYAILAKHHIGKKAKLVKLL